MRLRGHEIDTGVGEVNRVALLVEHVKKIVLDISVLLLARWKSPIGYVLQLHLLHELLRTCLLQHLQQPLVLRSTQLRLI